MGQPNVYWAGTSNYTSGNDGILYLFPHWTAGSFDAAVSTLQNPARQASAHYVIEGTKCAQLVYVGDTAWHCGNWWYNRRSIAYELVGWPGNPPSRETLDTCAHLMAEHSKRYFGGARLVHGQNVVLHREVYATSCPGETDVDWLIARANEILAGGGGDVNAWPVQSYAVNMTDAQRWLPQHNADGSYTLISCANGKALDVVGASAKSGTKVQVYTPNKSDAQKWKLVRQKKGPGGFAYNPADLAPFALAPLCAPKLRLDVKNADASDGATVQVYKANGTNAQNWQVLDLGDGTWCIVNVATGKALDVVNGGRS